MDVKNQKIFIAGHRGMVGSAIFRILKKKGYTNLITATRSELDLTNQLEVKNFFKNQKIDQVYLAAARVGGIYANDTYPAEFIYENLMIQTNVIHNSFLYGIKRLLFLGSSCIYPRNVEQPMPESSLLTGKLEPTNESYAIAKIAGIKMCESYNRQFGKTDNIDFRSIMPTNLYGPGDNYHSKNSHVIPALIQRFHHAKNNNLPSVIIWGSGNPRREFLFVEDMARACVLLMDLDQNTYQKHTTPMCSHINVGSGKDLTIKELSEIIKKVVGFEGEIYFDSSKPDGIPRKYMDSSLIKKIGFRPKVNLTEGLTETYKSYLKSL